jgi:hypothetical protein
MAMIIQKPLASLTESDLQTLVTNAVEENETLDYKIQMYGTGDGDRREMLRDVSAFANGRGGHILIGVREENEAAAEIVGIDNGDVNAERILSSCLAGIHERIAGLDARPILLANGRCVLAVFIPPSTRMPHMVTFQHDDRFWIRHGKQKMRMSVAEIREACLKVENLAMKAETFLQNQRKRFLEKRTGTVFNPARAFLRIAVTPLEVSVDRVDIDRQDIRALMNAPPNMRQNGWVLDWAEEENAKPMMLGLQIGSKDWRLLEVYRNGHVQFSVVVEIDSHFKTVKLSESSRVNVLYSLALVEYTVSVFRFYKAFAEKAGITDPLILAWDLIDAQGWGLRRDSDERSVSEYYGPRAWPERHLILPEIQITNLSEPDRAAKKMLDRLWQSFGFESAIYFNQDQHFAPP